MQTFLSIVIIIASIILIAVVAQMESEQAGLGTIQGSEDSSLWGAHRGSSKKDIQNRIVIVTSIVFAVALIILAAVK